MHVETPEAAIAPRTRPRSCRSWWWNTTLFGLLASAAGCPTPYVSTESTDANRQATPPLDDLGVLDLTGRPCDPLAVSRGRVVVLVFVRRDCPIANRYAPTLRTLHENYMPQGADFYLVYPDPNTHRSQIENHLREYGLNMPALHDPRHVLVDLAEASVTPEAAVFDRRGDLVYHGRIDDRYVEFGKARAEATSHDLQAAIQAAVADEPVTVSATEAVGCYISDLR